MNPAIPASSLVSVLPGVLAAGGAGRRAAPAAGSSATTGTAGAGRDSEAQPAPSAHSAPGWAQRLRSHQVRAAAEAVARPVLHSGQAGTGANPSLKPEDEDRP